MTDYILASRSPRRKALLRNLIENFLIINPEINEEQYPGEDPEAYALRIAGEKASAVGMDLPRNGDKNWIVIAADTIVVEDDKILGKPRDADEAARILARLRGRTHRVCSGIAVYLTDLDHPLSRSVSSEVLMRDYTDEEIRDYIASGDPLDKAGAYAIQNPSFNPAPGFQGCYANVMGLPLCHLSLLLREAGNGGNQDVANRCQESIAYQCPVYRNILAAAAR